jgi:MFS superfamily sulfate permease-like transporter
MNLLVAALRRFAELRENFSSDLLASLVVFLVALPLCMGIAIASGLDATAGLITGIIGGLVTGPLSGAPLQVSGPAAGLTVVVFQIVQAQGPGGLAAALLVAGGIQLAASAMRLGSWFRAVAPPVIEGMLAGIGILIVASQFQVLVDRAPQASGIPNLLALPSALASTLSAGGVGTQLAGWLGICTIGLIVLWKRVAGGRLQLVPAPLVAVALVTSLAAMLQANVRYVAVPDSLLASLRIASVDELIGHASTGLLTSALTIAVIASAETLLCASAVDCLHHGPRTRYNQELAAQGIGNMLCGLLGGLPMTGVIVRSAANVGAGAKSRWSAILHGAWLVITVALAGGLLRQIPTTALAGVLVYTGYKLVSPAAIRKLWQHGVSELAIFILTALVVVAEDLLTGVIVGTICAAVRLLWQLSSLHAVARHDERAGESSLTLSGAATFLRLPKLAAVLESVPTGSAVRVNLHGLQFVDLACRELLESWRHRLLSTGGTLTVEGRSGNVVESHDRSHDGNHTKLATAIFPELSFAEVHGSGQPI